MWNYFYGGSGYWGCSKVEVLDGSTSNGYDGANIISLPDEYTHYEVRFTLASSGNANVVKYLLFRLNNGDANTYIKNIKFYKINSTSGTNAINNLSVNGDALF